MSQTATEQLAEERVRELVGQYHDAYERRDKRAVADLFAEDAVISLAPGTFRGAEGIRRGIDWDWKATPTIRFRPVGIDVLDRGNVAVCEVMVEASYAGVRYEYPNVRVFEFGDDGRIRALRSYYDKLGIEQRIAHQLAGLKGRLLRLMLDRLVSEGEKGLR
jgi:ketosteroid isomerase-like protein